MTSTKRRRRLLPFPNDKTPKNPQILLCFIGGVFAGIRTAGSDVRNMYFIWGEDGEAENAALTAFLKFWSFIIIFTNFVPISLLVTLDMVKMFQSKMIGWDRQMYHEAREFDGTKRPMPTQVPMYTRERSNTCGYTPARNVVTRSLSIRLIFALGRAVPPRP